MTTTTQKQPATTCPHYQDNQGLCHRCGFLMDAGLWNDYLGMSTAGVGLVFTVNRAGAQKECRIDAVNSFGHVTEYSYRLADPDLIAVLGEWDNGRSISTGNQLTDLLKEFAKR